MPLDFTGATLNDSMRLYEMRTAWDAYNGRFSQPIHNRPRRNSDQVILNRCGPIIDKGVAFLVGKEVGFQLAEDADPKAQAWLDGFWKANRKMTTLNNMGVNGGVTGHVFVKFLETSAYPRLVVLDTTMLSVEHAPDDIENVQAYNIHYTAKDSLAANQATEYRQRIEQAGDQDGDDGWTITEQKKERGGWVNVGTPVPWPYPFSPIRQRQNLPNPNQFWGKPDLTPDLIQLNKDLNFVASNIQRIIKYHAHPKTWAKGLAGNKLSVAPDETIILPEGAELGALEMRGDLSSSRAFMRDLMTGMEVGARIPSISLGDLEDVPTGAISGIAIELLYGPALEKTETKRCLYGELLEDICRCALALGGFDPNTDIDIIWPDILPRDQLAGANVAAVYQGLGISKETVFDRLGFSYKDEQARLVEEARDAQVIKAIHGLPTTTAPGDPTTPDSPDQPEQDDTAFEATVMAATA